MVPNRFKFCKLITLRLTYITVKLYHSSICSSFSGPNSIYLRLENTTLRLGFAFCVIFSDTRVIVSYLIFDRKSSSSSRIEADQKSFWWLCQFVLQICINNTCFRHSKVNGDHKKHKFVLLWSSSGLPGLDVVLRTFSHILFCTRFLQYIFISNWI